LSAETVAAKIGMPPEQLFKTLAVRGDRNGIYLAAIPATEELDFKALAHQTGDRKDYPVYIDELAEICDVMSVSAGMRGLQISLAPDDYIRAARAN
jgi:Cys-tRNA(Pro)/Cys-tRNA(Cys) deacylase